jgi:4-amino-4-deoxy-L-arabinose transferase-like glycosyltransferase
MALRRAEQAHVHANLRAPMKGPPPWSERASRGVALLASVWFAFAAAWGMFGLVGDGHLGAGSAGNVMAAEGMLHWGIWYPTTDWYNALPAKSEYICHHPFGQYWIPAIFVWIFGHRDFVVHLPAVLMSAAMPPLLYGIAKERWGAPMGAVAAAAYTVVPIAVGFSSFTNLETFVIFGVLLFCWGHSVHMRTGSNRHLFASLAGVLVACLGDWVGYIIVTPILAWACLRAYVLPVWMTPRFRPLPYARWWALSVGIVAGTLVGWIALFHHVDGLKDFFASGTLRSSGNELPLHDVLRARKAWIYFSFTPLAIKLGKIALPVCLVRLVATRRDEETYAPSILLGAVIQYVKFKEGADVHIFWPHYFAPYFALSLAQLAGAIAWAAGWVAGRFVRARAATVTAATGLIVGLLPVAAMAHDGVASLWVWRRTGGRYNDNGIPVRTDFDTLQVIQDFIMPRTARGMTLDCHQSVGFYWHHLWKFQGQGQIVQIPAAASKAVATHPFWIARSHLMSSAEALKVASVAHVRVYGPTWVVDQREPPAPIDVFSMNEREPNPLQWLFLGGIEPVRKLGTTPDPWMTWELRTHLGQEAPLPTGEPRTLDEIRIAHNVAVARGDAAEAARWRQRLEAALDLTVAAKYDHGVNLIGSRITDGVEPRLETYFECTGGMTEAAFNVRTRMEKQGAFSLIPPDPTDREMAQGPLLPTRLWKQGMIYETHADLTHRIGVERYMGYWMPREGLQAPRRADGEPHTTLAVLP